MNSTFTAAKCTAANHAIHIPQVFHVPHFPGANLMPRAKADAEAESLQHALTNAKVQGPEVT